MIAFKSYVISWDIFLEIMLAVDQALKTDVRKLENILSFEEIKYLGK